MTELGHIVRALGGDPRPQPYVQVGGDTVVLCSPLVGVCVGWLVGLLYRNAFFVGCVFVLGGWLVGWLIGRIMSQHVFCWLRVCFVGGLFRLVIVGWSMISQYVFGWFWFVLVGWLVSWLGGLSHHKTF